MRPWHIRRIVAGLLLLCGSCLIVAYYKNVFKSQKLKDDPNEVLWWTDGMPWNYDEQRNCGFEVCRFTNKRGRLQAAHAILFYGSEMRVHDFPLPRAEHHLWGLLHEESPRNVPYAPYFDFLRHFNYSSTFSRFSDLPLTTQFLPRISDLSNLHYYSSFVSKSNVNFGAKLAPVVFLQTDCDTMTGREDYVRELMQHIMVDSYGGCLRNRDLPQSLQHDYLNNLYAPELLRFLARYKFMIAIENGVCEDYITEKFWRPLIAGVIPIYFGSPSIRDWQPHKKSAIFVEDFANAAALAEYLKQLNDNETAYNAYMGHKLQRQRIIDNQFLQNHLNTRSYYMSNQQAKDEDSIFRTFECFICRLLAGRTSATRNRHIGKRHYNCPHQPIHVPLQQRKAPANAEDWKSVINVGRCQAQLFDAFMRANRSYGQADFDAKLEQMVTNNLCN